MVDPNPKQAFGDKKPALDELPLIALIEVSLALWDGDNKYGFRNWRANPVEARTYIKAAIRHLGLWAEGEEHARDTGVNNLGAVMACCAILLDAQANGKLLDNRSKSQAAVDRLHDAEKDVARLKEAQAERDAAKAKQEPFTPEGTDATWMEEVKRANAASAIGTLIKLTDEWWESNADGQARLEPRISAAKEVILNMVNGVFPPLPEFYVGQEWVYGGKPSEFYKPGKAYAVLSISDPDDENGCIYLTDEHGTESNSGRGHGWSRATLKGQFTKLHYAY